MLYVRNVIFCELWLFDVHEKITFWNIIQVVKYYFHCIIYIIFYKSIEWYYIIADVAMFLLHLFLFNEIIYILILIQILAYLLNWFILLDKRAKRFRLVPTRVNNWLCDMILMFEVSKIHFRNIYQTFQNCIVHVWRF